MTQYMDFEKPLAKIEGKAEELRAMARRDPETDVTEETKALDVKAEKSAGRFVYEAYAWA